MFALIKRHIAHVRLLAALFALLLAAGAALLLFAKDGPASRAALWALFAALAATAFALYGLCARPMFRLLQIIRRFPEIDEARLKRILFGRGKSEALYDELREAMQREYDLRYQDELTKNQTTIAALQSQINPHFLYNTLDCIRGEAISRNQQEIADMTKTLSNFFRYSISRKGDIVTVWEEVRNVQSYFRIQQFRFSDLNALHIRYDENEAEILDAFIPKLTLQPIVENSIGHGLSDKVGTGTVTLTFLSTGRDIIIHCIDNGIGMDPQTLDALQKSILLPPGSAHGKIATEGSGIALRNVNNRIKLFFGEPYGISISSAQNMGTDIEIRIPLSGGKKSGESV